MNTHRIRTLGLLVAVATMLGGLSCRERTAPTVTLDSGFYEVMGTFAHVIVVAHDEGTAQAGLDAARDEILRVDALMSDYKPDSPLSQLNQQAATAPVTVDEELFDLLRKSIEYSRRTEGAFDITIGPLVDVWRRAGKQRRSPSQEELNAASQRVGFERLTLNAENRTVQFAVNGMRLDLGGIAKGHAIDRAVERVKALGALGGLVDIGGDLRCFGTPPEGRAHWTVGLQHPRDDQALLLRLRLNNWAVATSGDYRRFVVVEGQSHSLILDPAKRQGAKGLTSVTIFAPHAIDADVLATAVSVMGPEKGLACIEAQDQIEAILLESDSGQMVYSSGAEQFTSP